MIESKKISGYQGLGRGGNEEFLLKGHGVSIQSDRNVLELDVTL